MGDRDAWRGQLAGRGDGDTEIELVMPLGPGGVGGGSGAFPARASDGQRWWVKPFKTPQGPMVPTNEYIVGRVGAAISAPVCEVTIIRVLEQHSGWEFMPGHHLDAGLAYACREVPDAHEQKGSLAHRSRDDNAHRHVGVYALWDLCFGQDPQWLYQATDEERLFSHDHGLYFPAGPAWTEASLTGAVHDPHAWTEDPAGLAPAAIDDVAQKLDGFSAAAIVSILESVPRSWPVADSDLEALGWFLEERGPAVAGRLRAMRGGTP